MTRSKPRTDTHGILIFTFHFLVLKVCYCYFSSTFCLYLVCHLLIITNSTSFSNSTVHRHIDNELAAICSYLVRLQRVAFDDVEIGRVEYQLNGSHVTKSQRYMQHGLTLGRLQQCV